MDDDAGDEEMNDVTQRRCVMDEMMMRFVVDNDGSQMLNDSNDAKHHEE